MALLSLLSFVLPSVLFDDSRLGRLFCPVHDRPAIRLPWSARADLDTDGRCVLLPSSGNGDGIQRFRTLDSPREWLEHTASMEGEGAYTVIRCDHDAFSGTWSRFGQRFHESRLQESFEALMQRHEGGTDGSRDTSVAVQQTRNVIDVLLEEAKDEVRRRSRTKAEEASEDTVITTAMVTLLWSARLNAPAVRGHVCLADARSGPPVLPTSIRAMIATETDPDDPLPNRYQDHPEAKLSSWCSRRRPLEARFKLRDIGEVVLTREHRDGVQLLEGLTSNLFVVYRDGRIRTTDRSLVLAGYARKCVIAAAEGLGLTTECLPVRLEEADEWQEVFFTSSVRLVVPVVELLVPKSHRDGSRDPRSVWQQPPISSDRSVAAKVFERVHSDQRQRDRR